MQFLLIVTISYTCFYPNSSVILDAQTKSIVFTAWPSTTDPICETMDYKPFVPQLLLNGVKFTQSSLITYQKSKPTNFTLTCGQSDECIGAFSAKSATYNMFFTENSLSFEATVSEFSIKRFDYTTCIQDQSLQIDFTARTIHLVGDFTKCKITIHTQYPINLTLQMTAVLSASVLITLPPTTTLDDISDYMVVDCNNPTATGDCAKIMDYTVWYNFVPATILLPLPIKSPYPNEQFRLSYSRLYTEVRNVISVQAAQFSCVSSDLITLYKNQILLSVDMMQTPQCQLLYDSVQTSISLVLQLITSRNEISTTCSFTVDFDQNQKSVLLNCDFDQCQKLLSDFSTYDYTNAVYKLLFPLQTQKIFVLEMQDNLASNASAEITDENICVSVAIDFAVSVQIVKLTFQNVTLEKSTVVPNTQNLYCIGINIEQKAMIQDSLKNNDLVTFEALGKLYPVLSYQDATLNAKHTIGGWFILAATIVSIIISIYLLVSQK
uniref:Uncharacterized protein n=1 Tax=Trepomonas sp. PC1 TaxID=1076344 RepID=A0A146K2J7_9EUKA|eukprot:JAP89841.1 Hypothetical protein TPC1_30664 [Trepomonas sp. PC1]